LVMHCFWHDSAALYGLKKRMSDTTVAPAPLSIMKRERVKAAAMITAAPKAIIKFLTMYMGPVPSR
jgi:hypothetical protein